MGGGSDIGSDVIKEIMRDQPIARLGRSDEIAASVLWLCSPGASFVLGVALPVDGGFQPTEAPPSADRCSVGAENALCAGYTSVVLSKRSRIVG
jgi:Enoyl-(Acyl carrier protein) reductase